ncbi:hypothetical protein GCM10022237_27660 [Nocardioides ginsengisoli]|uniref:Uncharacterized protein n=1 Tax=Nocardioides ginsengisoli TaxID=363868 RepID=A0ABW3W4N3_9ACTN
MLRAISKLILGIAVALGLTLGLAPVADAAPAVERTTASASERATTCTIQYQAVTVAKTTYKKAETKVKKLKKKLKKAKKHHHKKQVRLLKKKLKKAKAERLKASSAVTSTSRAYATCQKDGSTIPGTIPPDKNPLDFLGELLDSLGVGALVDLLGLDTVIDLLGLRPLLESLGLGAILH